MIFLCWARPTQPLNSKAEHASWVALVFTTLRRVFVPFLEEIQDSEKAFRNYLTFTFDMDIT